MFDPLWVHFVYGVRWGFNSIPLHVDTQFHSTVCRKDCPFPLEWTWRLAKNRLTVCEGLLQVLSSSLLIYLPIFLPALCPFRYFSFVASFEIKNLRPPALFFVLQIVWAIRGPLWFHMNFRTGFSISVKMSLELWLAVYWLCGSLWVPLSTS